MDHDRLLNLPGIRQGFSGELQPEPAIGASNVFFLILQPSANAAKWPFRTPQVPRSTEVPGRSCGASPVWDTEQLDEIAVSILAEIIKASRLISGSLLFQFHEPFRVREQHS